MGDYCAWARLEGSTREHPAHEERVGHESQGMEYKNQQSTDSTYLEKQNDSAMGMLRKLTICALEWAT